MHPALARLAREGPLRFDRFQAEVLYGPEGFYASGGAAGRGGDFVTAVELGDEFARAVLRELDHLWNGLGRPDPFVVIEGGSGVGTLCASAFAIESACRGALRWVMVERSAVQRDVAVRRLAAEVFPDADELPVATAGDLGSLHLAHRAHVVLANELLDNLPVRIVRRTQTWQELYVESTGAGAAPTWRALDPGAARRATRHGREVEGDAAFPLVDHAVRWVARALDLLDDGGTMLVFDYTASTAELASRGIDGWLRTYAGQRRGHGPLDAVGEQDITADVALDQLPGRPTVEPLRTWLFERGAAGRIESARRLARGRDGDAEAVAARARLAELEALLDPRGIGGFSVLTWRR